jgi:hypothetical protein
MAMSRAARLGVNLGLLVGLIGTGVGGLLLVRVLEAEPPKEPPAVKLDAAEYVILATSRAVREYGQAIDKAKALHPNAARADFDPNDLDKLLTTLKQRPPRYALVFILPEELDVNFAWVWLTMTTRLDDDPFVDVRSGFITGATPKDAQAFMERIAEVATGRTKLPGAFVDDLGPPEHGEQKYFNTFPMTHFVPVVGKRYTVKSIAHGKNQFTDDRLGALDGAGLVHFGGHGHPDRIDDGLAAAQVPRLKLTPCVVFNGACYTGVTHRWFEPTAEGLKSRTADRDNCFCLKMLQSPAVAYLAAVHPDHGMPVYQEMEYLAYSGATLGDVIKHTHDGVILGAGGKLPALAPLKDGSSMPPSNAEIMLSGTAARLLFGDPAMRVGDAFADPPFKYDVKEENGSLYVTATLVNAALKSEFTDTFHNDLSPASSFNDRALLTFELPEGWSAVGSVEVVAVKAGGKEQKHRLVGSGIEIDGKSRKLHVQVDIEGVGFQQSPFRAAGSTVELVVRKAK